MSQQLRTRFCLALAFVFLCQVTAWAYKKENRLPLKGCNGYFAASGEVKSLEVHNEIKQKDREELIVEVKNVPMNPGTTLVVFVGDEEFGKIILDEKRSGILKVTSETKKNVPRIEAGTVIEVRTVGGRVILK